MTSLPDRMSSTLISPIANARQTHPANATPASGFTVLYADRSLLAVSKPPRLLSVPGRGEDKQDCLIHRVQQEFPDALIVHRIDYDTSGVLVLARGADMHRRLSRLFQDRKVEKRYIALVEGRPAPANGRIDLPLCVDWPNRPRHIVDPVNGKAALTYYQTLAYDAQGNLLKTYPIALGFSPVGHKQFEGDGKTPEGRYTINDRNPNSGYHKNLGVSYPNDADRAYAAAQGKSAGGDIKIHGMRNGMGAIGAQHLHRDWTHGCIAVTDGEIDELYALVKPQAEIEILP